MGGWLNNAPLNDDIRHPYLLPWKCHISLLICPGQTQTQISALWATSYCCWSQESGDVEICFLDVVQKQIFKEWWFQMKPSTFAWYMPKGSPLRACLDCSHLFRTGTPSCCAPSGGVTCIPLAVSSTWKFFSIGAGTCILWTVSSPQFISPFCFLLWWASSIKIKTIHL